MSERERKTLPIWLHREEADAWLVSLSGVGAGVFVPKSEIAIEEGHPVPTLMPVGPVKVEMPVWLAREKGLWAPPDPNQGSLFE